MMTTALLFCMLCTLSLLVSQSLSFSHTVIPTLHLIKLQDSDISHYKQHDVKQVGNEQTRLPMARRLPSGSVMRRRKLNFKFDLTTGLIMWNTAIFLLTQYDMDLKHRWMKADFLIARGESHRLLTALFLHGNFHHLMTNSYTLMQIGPTVCKLHLEQKTNTK